MLSGMDLMLRRTDPDGALIPRSLRCHRVHSRGYGSVKYLKKVEMRLSKIPGVERARLVSGARAGAPGLRSGKEKCSSEIMLDESAVNTLNVGVFPQLAPPAFHRLRHGSAARAARQSGDGQRRQHPRSSAHPLQRRADGGLFRARSVGAS